MSIQAAPKVAYLILEDGTIFKGQSIGIEGTTSGEICFNTGMTGYQEVFTDPSYYGQILVSTNVHIGNYGCKNEDNQSKGVKISGFVCRNFSQHYSRILGNSSLQEYFEENKVVGISNIDTRALVRKIRTEGAMNAIISSEITDPAELLDMVKKVPNMDGLELASKVGTPEAYYLGDENAAVKVAVLDYGVKQSILDCLAERGAYLKVFPGKTDLAEIMAWEPDGFFVSNGPGDPAAMDYALPVVKALIDDARPAFGICLGHQLFALACGIPTYKMHHGHRGVNHPVINKESGLGEITTQNHGFGVSPDAIYSNLDKIAVTHQNLNDKTIEGIRILGKNAFSVQFHPEASAGPHDSRYLFDQFIQEINNYKNQSL